MVMATEARYFAEGDVIDHTPSSALSGGDILQVGGRAAVAVDDIAASALGAVRVKGIMRVEAAAVCGNVGDPVWWDDNGTPVGGSATGAATTIKANGDYYLGILTQELETTDGYALVAFNEINPECPPFTGWRAELITDNKTLDAQDHLKVIEIATDAKVITLPATAAGLEFIIRNVGDDGNNIVTVDPNADDKIMGPDLAGVDNKDRINTKATAIHGDWLHLKGDGKLGWLIMGERGTWAAE